MPLLIGLLAVALLATALVVSGAYGWLVDNGMMTDFRIMLGLYQILAQADTVLRISFPSPVPELLAVAKLLFLDVRAVLHMEWYIGTHSVHYICTASAPDILFCCCCVVSTSVALTWAGKFASVKSM